MVINNCIEFYYLILRVEQMNESIPFVEDLKNCVRFYSDMCSCQGQTAISHKKRECELIYQKLINDHLSDIKNYFLQIENEFTFKTTEPEEKVLANISKIM